MQGHHAIRPMILTGLLLVILMGTAFQPFVTGPDHTGLASATVVKVFDKDKKRSDQVLVQLRAPTYKDHAGIQVPSDGQVIKGQFNIEAKEWTQDGLIAHNTSADFQTASSLEHVKVDNGSVRLEDVPADLVLSSLNAWGHGTTKDLVAGDQLSLSDAPWMAFLWDNVLSNASNEQENVILKVDREGTTHCIYEDNSKGLDVYYARSVDGLHYTDFKYLDTTNNRFIPQESPDMVVDSNDVIHVVYSDGRTTVNDLDIYYTKSTDHGYDFTQEKRIDHGGTAYQTHPALAVDKQGNVFVAWEDTRDGNTTIYYNKNFGQDTRVSMGHIGYQLQPKLAVDSNDAVHIVWRDNRSGKDDWRIYHAVLPAGTTTFQNETMVYWVYFGFQQYFPTIVSGDNGRVYVAWADNSTFEYNIYLSHTDDGATFSTPVRVTPPYIRALAPTLSYMGGTLHFAWYDYRDNWTSHVYYMNMSSSGKFSSTSRVDHSNGSIFQRSPSLTVGTDGWPRVAWVDFRQHQSGDLFATKGTQNHMQNGSLDAWMDLGYRPYAFTGVNVTGDLPVGSLVDVTGQTSPDNRTWSSPVHLKNDSKNLTADRYIHLKVFISTNNTGVTPYVSAVTVHYKKYAVSGTLVSTAFNVDHPISKMRVEWGAPFADDGLNVSISLDGGLSWTRATNGLETSVSTAQRTVEYKLEMVRRSFGTPFVDWIKIQYTEHSFPSDLKVVVGDTNIFQFSGEFTVELVTRDLAKAINDYIRSLPAGTIPPGGNVTVPIDITSGELGDLELLGLSLDVAMPPKLSASSPGGTPTADEGQDLVFSVTVKELDGRPLAYSWTVNSVVLDNQTNYTMTYNIPYTPSAPRTDKVSVVVSNGYLSVSRSWNVKVLPSNRAPVIDSQLPKESAVLVDSKIKMVPFSVTAHDPDSDPLTYTWMIDGTQIGANESSLTLDPKKYSVGSHDVSVEVSDGKAKAGHDWSVIILPRSNPKTDDSGRYLVVYAILALIVVLLCGIAFMEAYRRARGDYRARRKRMMDEDDVDRSAYSKVEDMPRPKRPKKNAPKS